jgi:hypothetical protein
VPVPGSVPPDPLPGAAAVSPDDPVGPEPSTVDIVPLSDLPMSDLGFLDESEGRHTAGGVVAT